MNLALSFDDVLLIPQQTYGGSRDEVDLSTTISGKEYKLPFISANMSTVTESRMLESMRAVGGFGILHRMMDVEEQKEIISKHPFESVWVSIEGSKLGIDRIRELQEIKFCIAGYCIDVAHADSPTVIDTVVEIRKTFGLVPLIIGNYATAEGIWRLLHILGGGDDNLAFKVGVGSGSQCTTRIVTGCGLPTLESIFQIRKVIPDVTLIADGGIKNSGDIVKALAAGADAVMLGSILAGTAEAPGNVIKSNGNLYKIYRGSASYGQKYDAVGHARYVEGEETLVRYKGHAEPIIRQLVEGVKSGFSYCGAMNLRELRENSEFVQITTNGYQESLPHGAI
jgi:IMP dehydrogenase